MKLGFRAIIIAVIGIGLVSVITVRGCRTPKDKGKILYELHCQSCHGEKGEGFYSYPPIAGVDYVEDYKDEIACIIYYGMEGPIEVDGVEYDGRMLGNPQLTETQIANLANYIYDLPGNTGASFNKTDIQNQLENCNYKPVK